MNLLEAMDARVSRRTYIDARIDSKKALYLTELIYTLNATAGLSMEFVENGAKAFDGLSKSYGLFKGVRSLFVLKGPTNDPHLMEKCGYYGQQLVLEATRLELGTCWVGGSFDKSARLVDLKADESIVCVITVGEVFDKLTLKESMINGLTHRRPKPTEYFYISDDVPPHWFLQGLEAVKSAPSAKNIQPVKFHYENKHTFATVQLRNPFDLIDLGIAKYHFELKTGGRFELGNGGVFTLDGDTSTP